MSGGFALNLEFVIIFILFCSMISFYRLIKGPHPLDRIAAVSAIGIMLLIVLVLLGAHFNRALFIDVALVYGVLLFIDVLVMAKYFGTPGRHEEEES